MNIIIRDVKGETFELNFAEDSPTLTAVRAKMQADYKYNASKAVFCHAGVAIPDNSKISADFMGEDKTLIMVDYDVYAEKSYPAVDNAFHFGTPRYHEFFQKPDVQMQEEANVTKIFQKKYKNGFRPYSLFQFIQNRPRDQVFQEMSNIFENFRRLQGANIGFDDLLHYFIQTHENVTVDEIDAGQEMSDSSDEMERTNTPIDSDFVYSTYFSDDDEQHPHFGESTEMELEHNERYTSDEEGNHEEEEELHEEEEEEHMIEQRQMDFATRIREQDDQLVHIFRQREITEEQNQLRQFNIELTPQDEEAINRLTRIGYDRLTVIQVYMACDKDEEMTTNCLISMG